jgi:exopolysaccharide production protein ExoQ
LQGTRVAIRNKANHMLTLKLSALNLLNLRADFRRRLETGFAAFGLLFLPGSEVVWQGFIFVVFALACLILMCNWRAVCAAFRRTWPILLPVLFAACSLLWSVDPALTLHQTIALTGTTAFGAFLAVRFSLKEQLKILALVLGIVACASAMVALLLPSYGVMSGVHSGAWSGIFYHKNSLGRIMALATLVFSLLALDSRKLRTVAVPATALCTALVFATRSRASVIVLIVCFAAAGALLARQQIRHVMRKAILIVAAVVAIPTAAWAIHQGDRILAFLGFDPTFNGRTELWAVLLEQARARPWFGYGYGAFWRGTTGVSGEVQKALNWDWYPVHGHNGFLDLVLELGIVGLLTLLIPLCIYGYQTYRWGTMRRSPLRLWPVTYLLFFVLGNLAESALVRQNSIYWTLYVAALCTVHQSNNNVV